MKPLPHSAIILVVDGLGTGCLGPYGATWLDTPNFNVLAAEALLLENVLADSPALKEACRAYWHGQHALTAADASATSIVSRLAEHGVATTFITDDADVAEHPLAEDFGERVQLQPDASNCCASDIEATQLASLFSTAVDALQQQPENFMLWIHARGMQSPWDAPLEFRQSLVGEDDPDPPSDVAVPSLLLPEDYDPDLLLGIVQSYAGQVMLLDTCLGVLMDAIRAHPRRDELLVIVTSPRGFPLGEHLAVGDCRSDLYSELLHVPLLVWRGDDQGAAARDQALVQPADLAATLLDWFSTPSLTITNIAHSLLPLTQSPSADWPRDRAVSIAAGQRAVRTPAWFLRESHGDGDGHHDESRYELFGKPDDRWEVNDVANRCPVIVKQLTAALEEFGESAASGCFEGLAKMPDELVAPVE